MFRRFINWLVAESGFTPIPMDGVNDPLPGYNSRCPECGVTQMVVWERDCINCGHWVSSWDHELPHVTPHTIQLREDLAADFYRARCERMAAA